MTQHIWINLDNTQSWKYVDQLHSDFGYYRPVFCFRPICLSPSEWEYLWACEMSSQANFDAIEVVEPEIIDESDTSEDSQLVINVPEPVVIKGAGHLTVWVSYLNILILKYDWVPDISGENYQQDLL